MNTPNPKTPGQVIADLEYTPTCGVGNPGELSHGRVKPCTCPALYALEYHACPQVRDHIPATGAGTVLICAHHLALLKIQVAAHIAAAAATGQIAGCYCGHIYQTPDDMIVHLTPLGNTP